MEKNYVTVVYDRRKRVNVTGMGKVELHIYFNRRERKYICVNECNPIAWRKYQKSDELANEISLYEKIIQRMIEDGEELNVRNFNTHLGVSVSEQERKKSMKSYSSSQSFLDFMKDCISKYCCPVKLF